MPQAAPALALEDQYRRQIAYWLFFCAAGSNPAKSDLFFGKWHVLGSFWELHKWYIYEVGKEHRHDLETVLAGNSDSWKQLQAVGSSATVSD